MQLSRSNIIFKFNTIKIHKIIQNEVIDTWFLINAIVLKKIEIKKVKKIWKSSFHGPKKRRGKTPVHAYFPNMGDDIWEFIKIKYKNIKTFGNSSWYIKKVIMM